VPTAPRGPFSSADDAALAWANHIHSTSLFIRHEHGVIIYRTEPGVYRLTRTVSGLPHSVGAMNDLFDTVPSGATGVAGVHTHHFGPNFSGINDDPPSGDIDWAHFFDVDVYISAPTTRGSRTSFHLRRYTVSTSENTRIAFVSLRPLSESEREALVVIYRATWNAHLPCSRNDCPPPGGWPTSPWPPR